MKKVIDIGNEEDAIIDYDDKRVSFMRYGSIIGLRTISFNTLTNIYTTIKGLQKQPIIISEIKKPLPVALKKELPIVKITNKGFQYIIVDINELRVVIHGEQCNLCYKYLIRNIRYVAVLEAPLCERCFDKWHDKVTDGGLYKYKDSEDIEIKRAMKNITKLHKTNKL